MTPYEVSIEKGAFNRHLTPAQRAFAETIINCIAQSDDPFNYRDSNGAVKALKYNRDGQYSYKPNTQLRNGYDLEIRIVFKPSKYRKLVIIVIEVAPRELAYK